MISKLRFLGLIVATMIIATAASVSSADEDNESATEDFTSKLIMGTASPGGVYFPIGTEYGRLFEKYIDVDGLSISAVESAGTIENIAKIERGELQLGLGESPAALDAFKGEGQFEGAAVKNVGVIGALYPSPLHIVTLEENDIRSVEDLKGQRVASGAPGAANHLITRKIFQAYGIGEDYIALNETGDAARAKLKDGNVEALFELIGVPYGSLQELEAGGSTPKLLSLNSEVLGSIEQETPFEAYTIDSEAYDFLTDDVQTVTGYTMMFASTTQVSEELAYEITKMIYEHADELTLPQGDQINLDTALGGIASMKLHPGAKKFYEEKGLISATRSSSD